jgi:outer membrane receptor protein involved in Fe transport
LTYRPNDWLTLRAAYSETVARQTFKELTPVIQQEFLGGPLFVGNPELTTSNLENFDLRADVTPYAGGLFSVSWFHKNIDNPIENVQRLVGFDFTTPVNYPEGKLTGYEVELRQDLSLVWDGFRGLQVGGNATLIDSEVTLPDDEIAGFSEPNIQAPLFARDATNAPEYLYNLYLTYDLQESGTQLALFYTVKGDTLIAGAAESEGNFVPNVYEQEFGTLNFSLSQRVGDHWVFQFQAKNLTNPHINTIYRSDFIDGDALQTSFRRGIEYSIGFSFIP